MGNKDLQEIKENLSSQSEETFLSKQNLEEGEGAKEEAQQKQTNAFELPAQPQPIEISQEEVEENINSQKKKLDEVEQSVSKQNTKKSKIINIVFFIINIAVVAGILTYQLTNEEWVPISGLRINVPSLLMIILLLVLVVEPSILQFLFVVAL